MTDYETAIFPLDEWSEMDCHLMEADGWTQDGPAKGGWIRYRRPVVKQEKCPNPKAGHVAGRCRACGNAPCIDLEVKE